MVPQRDEQEFSFPSLNSVTHVLRQLKKEENSLFNCVCSVSRDVGFIDELSALHPDLPLAANLRCGLWYVRNAERTCYFKSTDGHNGNWSFSTTRLNIDLAETAANHGGCVIVDATRRGKSFPDSLTKTIPIWAAVLNRAVAQLRSYHDSTRLVRDSAFVISSYPQSAHTASRQHRDTDSPSSDGKYAAKGSCLVHPAKTASNDSDWDIGLHLPPWVSSNERMQIEAKLDQWVRQLCQVSGDVGRLAALLDKPLRPIWLSQDSRMWLNAMADHQDLPFTPLYLVSASKTSPERQSIAVGGGETYSYSYVPGAGDDEESWACGLTPALFWQHQQELLQAGPAGIKQAVADLLQGVEQKKRDGLGRTLSMARLSSTNSNGQSVETDKHHPAPGGVEVSRTTLPAHGLAWLGCTRLAVGPTPAGDPSYIWGHVDAVLNAATPSRQELKASRSPRTSSGGASPQQAHSMTNGTSTSKQAQHAQQAGSTSSQAGQGNYLRLPIASSKADKHSLEHQLPAALEFVSGHLAQHHQVLITCDTGEDQCVCVAVAVFLACFRACKNDAAVHHFVRPYNTKLHKPGTRLLMPDGTPVTKQSIRRVLAVISRLYPLARPTRGLLKQVFNFFEPPRNVAAAAAAATAAGACTPHVDGLCNTERCNADDSTAAP